MALIDVKYDILLNHILAKGYRYEDPNRKGVNRIEIADYKFEYNMDHGLPFLTTKKMAIKSIVGELLWILKGDTNIKYLVDNGIPIWNKDAYNYYKTMKKSLSLPELSYDDFIDRIKSGNTKSMQRFFDLGDVGRNYGYQLRNWNGLDQLKVLIAQMKHNPMGTKKTVTYWNPTDSDRTALTPCHWSFEIIVEPISLSSRQLITKWSYRLPPSEEELDRDGTPKYQFTLKWHQHSVDTFLGLPFNIAFYGLLAHILGRATNMKPKTLIGDLSNVHIYKPHLDAVNKQLSNEVYKYNKKPYILFNPIAEAKLKLDDNIDAFINSVELKNVEVKNYESFGRIPAEMLAYNK